MHHVVCIYALHMPIWQVNTFQLKEWFGIHKYMYYAHCAILLILVDKSGDSNNHCFLNNNVSFHPITVQLGSLDLY